MHPDGSGWQWSVQQHKEMFPLFERINGQIGPFASRLLAAWREAGIGGPCARCRTTLEEGWCGAECPCCEREYQEAKGCRCGGTGICPECLAAGMSLLSRSPKRCPDCDSLCPVCCPDS